MTEDNSWRTPSFRQNVVAKINEAIQTSGMSTSKSSIEMENHVFVKARNKDEYLSFVARLILHVREMNTKNKMQGAPGGGDVSNSGGMPDPINALQNLASQGSRPQQQMMGMGGPQGGPMGGPGGPQGNSIPASNLLQTLTQQRPMQQAPMQGMQPMQGQRAVPGGPGPMAGQMGGGGQMGMGMGGMSQAGGGGPSGPGGMPMGPGMNAGGPNSGPGGPMQMNPGGIQGQMGGMAQMGMNPVMSQGQMGNAMTPVSGMGGPMNPGAMGGMGGPMGPGMMGPMTSGANVVIQQQPQQQGGMNAAITTQGGGMGPGAAQMNPGQLVGMPQMTRKGPEMMMGQQGGVFPGVRSVTPNQFLRQSPSPSVPSPASMGQPHQQGMVPSPAMVPSPSPQSMSQGPPRSMGGVMTQSPSSTLNTPGQASVYSPLNPQEDLLYREKYRQLTKYIEPLKRMIARMVNDKNNGNLQKMNKLLEILCNPNQRIPLETLLKCEKALEKMDFKTNVLGPVSAQGANAKEHPINNPLLEAVSANLQNPIGNHTLQRTFRPCLEALFGPDIKNLPPPAKQPRMASAEESAAAGAPEIPHILQGEIARLDQKFKINLDPSAQIGTRTIKLVCCLDDKYLPCVPPVSVSIPDDYPSTAPTCNLMEQEYNATPFLVAVQKALTARISKLPRQFSLSHLLDTWEMSVRQACAPVIVSPSQTTVLLGI